MKLSTRAIPIALLLALAAAGCRPRAQEAVPTPPASPEAPTTSAAGPQDEGQITILADGQLVAVSPILPMAFEVGGRLLSVDVRPGQTLAAGDLLAVLDDRALREAVAAAELASALAANGLAQAQAALDELVSWRPDPLAVAAAEANLAAAESNLERAKAQDAAAANGLTAARVSLDQARRALADAEAAYQKAWDPARDWELNDPFRADALRAERDAVARGQELAREGLAMAQAQYNLALAGLNQDSAAAALAAVAGAEQALAGAGRGPADQEIAAARLRAEQAQIALDQSNLSLAQARLALSQTRLVAPWPGVVASVEAAAGALVGAGSPVLTLLDTGHLQFHTSNLSERDLATIVGGQPAEIVLKASRIEPWPAG
jgi:multidrug resistance efflux pump